MPIFIQVNNHIKFVSTRVRSRNRKGRILIICLAINKLCKYHRMKSMTIMYLSLDKYLFVHLMDNPYLLTDKKKEKRHEHGAQKKSI